MRTSQLSDPLTSTPSAKFFFCFFTPCPSLGSTPPTPHPSPLSPFHQRLFMCTGATMLGARERAQCRARPQAPCGEVQAPRSSSPGGAAVVVVAVGASDEANASAPLPSSESAAPPPAKGKGAVEAQEFTGGIAQMDCDDNGSGQAQQQIVCEEDNLVAPIALMPFCPPPRPPTSRDPAPAEVAAETPPPAPATIVKFWPKRLPVEEEVSCPTRPFGWREPSFFSSFLSDQEKERKRSSDKNQERLVPSLFSLSSLS